MKEKINLEIQNTMAVLEQVKLNHENNLKQAEESHVQLVSELQAKLCMLNMAARSPSEINSIDEV